MRRLTALATALPLLLCANFAYAWHISGNVYCDGNGRPLAGVTVNATGCGFTGSSTTDEAGAYFIALPDEPCCYDIAPDLGAEESVVSPSGAVEFCPVVGASETVQNFVISSPKCTAGACWLTAGGAKFSNIIDTNVGVSKRITAKSTGASTVKEFNWGGNVNPGCSPTAGEGGQWNTLDVAQKLHFQGFAIQVVRCGNVDGIPPGSTSPVTPFNFIEFKGTGRVQGIQGNKADYPNVFFWARCEDRNEPGSNGQRDGAGKDRYFLNVYTNEADPVGSSIIIVDVDNNPATVDPLTITDGNMQLHISSCDFTTSASLSKIGRPAESSVNLPTEVSFATPRPNPAGENTSFFFALPREAKTSLTIYDVAGRQVNQLLDGVSLAGARSVTWNLTDGGGFRVSRGMYFARLTVDGRVYTRQVTVSE